MVRNISIQVTLKVLLLILILSFNFSPLHAQNDLPDSLVTVRLQYIKNTLERDRTMTQRWWYGWLVGYSAATILQGSVYFTSNETKMRQDMALGAATTLLGAAGQLISPLIPGIESGQLNSISVTSRSERLNKLAFAEKLLKDCARREKLARSWKYHALCSAVNMGGGLITSLGFKRSVWAGVGYFAFNSVITETQIWTQPTLAKRNYKKYLQEYPEKGDGISYSAPVNYYLQAYPGGIGIKVVF
jgi:hypothetical protein